MVRSNLGELAFGLEGFGVFCGSCKGWCLPERLVFLLISVDNSLCIRDNVEKIYHQI